MQDNIHGTLCLQKRCACVMIQILGDPTQQLHHPPINIHRDNMIDQ